MMHIQFHVNFEHVHSDNGKKFLSHATLNFFANHGVLHERTCVKTFQQIGIAENKSLTTYCGSLSSLLVQFFYLIPGWMCFVWRN